MIHALEMHQFVDQYVVADPIGHRDQPPVQTDVAVRRTRSPAPPLIANADSRNRQAVLRGEFEQPRREDLLRARDIVRIRRDDDVGRDRLRGEPMSLLTDPRLLAFDKRRCFSFRSPPRNGDAHAPIRPNANDVTPRARMTHKVDQWPPYTTKPRLRRLSARNTSIAFALEYGIGFRCAYSLGTSRSPNFFTTRAAL